MIELWKALTKLANSLTVLVDHAAEQVKADAEARKKRNAPN